MVQDIGETKEQYMDQVEVRRLVELLIAKSDYDTFIIQTDSSDYVIVDNNVTSVTSSESLPYMFVIEGSLGNYEISQIASGENVKVYVGKSGTDNGGYFLVPDDFITLIRQNM